MTARRPGSVAPGDGLRSPVFLVALALMALNDQVLKAAVPSDATGKLSDLAGMVVAPVLAVSLTELLLRRPLGVRAWWAAAALTGLAFTLVQVWAPASSLYEHVFGLARWPVDAAVATIGDQPVEGPAPVRLWPDATDLLVLPVLLVVPWLARRRIPDAPVAPPRGGATVAR